MVGAGQTKGRRTDVLKCEPGLLKSAIDCGTYGATSARSQDRTRQWHSAGWIGLGGGRGLGEAAWRAVVRSAAPKGKVTALTERLLEHFEVASIDDLIYIRSSRTTRHRRTEHTGTVLDRLHGIEGLSRIVLDAAEQGDKVALRIVREEAKNLAKYALFAAHEVGIEVDREFPLVLLGGVFKHQCPLLPDAVAERVQKKAPGARRQRGLLEPVCGAAILALEGAGEPVDDKVRANLLHTCPSFDT